MQRGRVVRRGWHCPPLGTRPSPASGVPSAPAFQQALTSRQTVQSYKCFRPSLELPQAHPLCRIQGPPGQTPCFSHSWDPSFILERGSWGVGVGTESLLARGKGGKGTVMGDDGRSRMVVRCPHWSRSLRNESSTAGSGNRAQGSLSMLRPSRPSGSMRSSSSSPRPSSNPPADTSKPGTPARAAAISLEKPGEVSPVGTRQR